MPSLPHRPLTRLNLNDRPWVFTPTGDGDIPHEVKQAFADGPLPAVVPGCVHDDLLRHDLIADPYLGDNEASTHWIGHHDWRYETTLPVIADAERIDLVCEGLDTVTTVSLDGADLAQTANMHRTYRFDVTGRARSDSQLAIEFTSAYTYTDKVREQIGDLPTNDDQPFPLIRKMASNYGWDWGPTVVTCGVWRPIRLEAWSTARLASVRPSSSWTGAAGRLDLVVDIERAASGIGRALTLDISVGGQQHRVSLPRDVDTLTWSINLSAVKPWWPHGLGDQALYDLGLRLLSDETDGTDGPVLLDSWQTKVGFRTIELDTTEDETGRRFTFIVNGHPIFARGFNWIPNDVLVARVTMDDYRARLLQAREAGATMIRVWGGGVFESDGFYALCDELGLMVWQDFLFACSVYPETPELLAEVEAEARDNVTRLMSHPSLALWCGNNENFMGYDDWNWQERLHGRPWGEAYYLDILPSVVHELDPTHPYWPGSPYSGLAGHKHNDPAGGCYHSWVAWNERGADVYLTSTPRFVTEFGWQAPPAYTTLRDAIGPEHLLIDDPVLACHQKAFDGMGKLARGIAEHVDVPTDFDRWHYVAQVVQARDVCLGIDHWRAGWPHCAGSLVWQINDCWPVASWAAVDSAGRRKPVWWSVRDSFADRRVSIQPGSNGLDLIIVNNGIAPWRVTPQVRRVCFDGTVLAVFEPTLSVAPSSVISTPLPSELTQPNDPGSELILVDSPAGRYCHAFAPDRDLVYPTPALRVETVPAADTMRVTVHADTVLRDLLLQADRLEPTAVADSGLVTLLPGETHQWTLTRLTRAHDPAQFTFPVLMSMGDLLRP